MNFLRDLKEYDKDNIPVSVIGFCQLNIFKNDVSKRNIVTNLLATGLQVNVMQKIRSEYMTNPDFDPSKVAKASSAAEGLCKWIKAIEVYDRVAKVQSFWSSITFSKGLHKSSNL